MAWARATAAGTVRAGALIAAVCLSTGPVRAADTCWTHNGSLMRLVSDGTARRFVYERPRPGLEAIGVRRGTVLFRGERRGGTYTGLARQFSTECPGEATDYVAEGPVSAGERRIVLTGRRELYRRCRPTDRFVEDVLVFTYARRC